MADDKDDAQKTEEPTQKKLDDAHEKGDVAKSQEVRHWFVLTAIALALMITGTSTASAIKASLTDFLAYSGSIPANADGLLSAVRGLAVEIGLALSLPALILIIGALGGALIQHKPVFTTERMKPKLDRISPLGGVKRLFSMHSMMEFSKTVFKFAAVGAISLFIIWPERDRLDQLMTISLTDVMLLVQSLSLRLLAGVIAVMAAIAGLDFMFQQAQHIKKMRMTKQEVKDEHKQLEGDPHVKARLRQIRMERSRSRMMAAVPEADVVITNPTHYAIALSYKHENMDVPKVLAKGVDHMAKKIRELAEEHGVPLVENPPLARTLYATVELDEEIKPEHYKAVAEVIGFIMKLRKPSRR